MNDYGNWVAGYVAAPRGVATGGALWSIDLAEMAAARSGGAAPRTGTAPTAGWQTLRGTAQSAGRHFFYHIARCA
jgi:hypothetical protein